MPATVQFLSHSTWWLVIGSVGELLPFIFNGCVLNLGWAAQFLVRLSLSSPDFV